MFADGVDTNAIGWVAFYTSIATGVFGMWTAWNNRWIARDKLVHDAEVVALRKDFEATKRDLEDSKADLEATKADLEVSKTDRKTLHRQHEECQETNRAILVKLDDCHGEHQATKADINKMKSDNATIRMMLEHIAEKTGVALS